MEQIKRQVRVARRRLIMQRFLLIVAWSLFITLLAAVIGVSIPKIWVIPVDAQVWMWSWIGGSVALGLVIASIWTYVMRASVLEAAIEIDQRFRLKERISSSLAMHPDELESEVGRALIEDAIRRVERIDVRDSFPVRADWRALLPLIPAAIIFGLVFIPDAMPDNPGQAAAETTAEADQVKRSARELKKRLDRAKKKAEERGLEDADLMLKQIQKGLEDLANRNDIDRKDAMVKMNDMAKSLQERREKLGGADQMKNQLNRLKDLQQGPADKIAKAMQEGDFKKALDELKNLQDKLKNDELNEEQKEQLAKQMDQLKDKLQEMVDAHKQAKQELQEQIEQKKAAGDLAGAGKLQQQLDKLNQMNDAMNRMQQMADNMNECKKCLQQGEGGEAAAQLEQMAQNLQELQEQLQEMEALDQIMEDMQMAKDAMGCKQCNGEGCQGCMGQFGMGNGQQGNGFGMGEGEGRGDRPEEETDTNFYESQVRGKVQPGAAVVTGTVGGPNRAGKSLEEVKQEISSNLTEDADPLIDVRLPRKEADQARQYFERLRKGE